MFTVYWNKQFAKRNLRSNKHQEYNGRISMYEGGQWQTRIQLPRMLRKSKKRVSQSVRVRAPKCRNFLLWQFDTIPFTILYYIPSPFKWDINVDCKKICKPTYKLIWTTTQQHLSRPEYVENVLCLLRFRTIKPPRTT